MDLLVLARLWELKFSRSSPSTSSGDVASPSSISFSISLLPSSPTVIVGQQVSFTSPFVGNLLWKVNGIVGGDSVHGTIDPVGQYTSPTVAPTETVSLSAQLGMY